MGRIRGPEIPLDLVEMTVEQNAVEYFRHGIGGVHRAANLEILHESKLYPFL
jgi:hypothetical protein